MNNRLHRSRDNRMIAGVCGGISETYNIDPAIVRIVFAFLGLTSGVGILLYVIALFVMPEDDDNNIVNL